jgi:GntR family transcriptional regulator
MKFNFPGKQDVYIEVADYYKKLIQAGVYVQSDKLPSVRSVAGELGINPNTAAKAYSLLEEWGYVCALPKKGAYVTYTPQNTEAKNKQESENFPPENSPLWTICENTVIALKKSGITKEKLLEIIEEVYRRD